MQTLAELCVALNKITEKGAQDLANVLQRSTVSLILSHFDVVSSKRFHIDISQIISRQ